MTVGMRQIFEKAIELLKPTSVRDFSLRYAKLETSLGEIDRARAIFTHAAQFCPPQRDEDFWQVRFYSRYVSHSPISYSPEMENF